MSDAEQELETALNPDDEDATFVVADAEDYNQSRRLKAIHQARADVRKAHRNVSRGKAPKHVHDETRADLARAVAYYATELEPLMQEAEWDRELPAGPWDTIDVFVATAPKVPPSRADEWDRIPEQWSMTIFSRLNEFAREAGLGIDLKDSSDEWEV